MDRFIADKKFGKAINVKNLKSNMDRFIAKGVYFWISTITAFKIQYG